MRRALVIICFNADLVIEAATRHGTLHAVLALSSFLLAIAYRYAGHLATAVVQLYAHARGRQAVQAQQ